MTELMAGQITWFSSALLCAAALVTGGGGGALGGMWIGGKHLGYGLAAMMGGFFGATTALPAAAIALTLLSLF